MKQSHGHLEVIAAADRADVDKGVSTITAAMLGRFWPLSSHVLFSISINSRSSIGAHSTIKPDWCREKFVTKLDYFS